MLSTTEHSLQRREVKARTPRRNPRGYGHDPTAVIAFLTPKFLMFSAFVVVPFVYTFVLMFEGGGLLTGFHFVGLLNFRTLLHDQLFFATLEHTALFMVITIPLVLASSVAVGTLFASQLRGMAVYRSLIYIPSLLSIVTTSLIWQVMLDPHVGLVYQLVNVWLGWNIPWLSVGWVAIVTISVISAWVWLGFYSIIIMAGLNAQPGELFEAARIDGCTSWTVFWFVKLPLLRPILQLVLVLLFINTIQVFDIIYVLTSGGPGTSTYTVMWYIYENVFNQGSVGYAAAMGVLVLLVTLFIAGVIVRSLREST